MRRKKMQPCFFLLFLSVIAICAGKVKVQIVLAESVSDTMTDTTADAMEETLLEEMELEQVQQMIDQMLGEESFSFSQALKNVLSGKEVISKETVQELVYRLFFSGIEKDKNIFFKLLLLVLIAAIFSNFVDVFENGQVGAVSFYMVYLMLFMMLMEVFSQLGSQLAEKLSWLAQLLRTLAPAYFIAVTASSGASSGAVFYEGALLMVWAIQWILQSFILPGAHLCVLLKLINHLSKEEMLSKLAELLETVISWGMKTLLTGAVGLEVIKNLVAPVMDSLKRTAIGRTAGAIPGIGNAVNSVTELVLTSAVLVRNSLGVVILLVVAAAGIEPVLHYGTLSLSYRFLAALAQPVSDKRIVGALSTMGEGCAMLLKIVLTAEVLCMLTFLILMSGTGTVS